jgi:hypothetical protein
MRAKFINEELLGTLKPMYMSYNENINVEIYLNPRSIKNMESYTRAISDDKGNVFVADTTYAIHIDIYNFLIDQGIFSGKRADDESVMGYMNSHKYVCWQREGNTNIFLLGESYGQIGYLSNRTMEGIRKLTDKVQQKNPQFNFKIIGIHQ